jgi:hypothetical protein
VVAVAAEQEIMLRLMAAMEGTEAVMVGVVEDMVIPGSVTLDSLVHRE